MPNIVLDRTLHHFCKSYSMIFGKSSSVSESEEQWKEKKCLRTMRQSFHRALTTCRAPLPPGKKYVAVQFLTKELIFYVVDTKGKGQEVFEEACKHLGILDTELFGLSFYKDGEYVFIDLNLKVSKYAVRSWKTHSSGIGGDGQPLLMFHMRIKYYVDCHLLISEKVVRHHYYLQLRENVKNYSQAISEEKSFLLSALALQADLGNYDEEKHKEQYFEINNYFPPWIVAKIGEDFIIRNIPALHKDNAGLSRGEAQVGYIKEASDVTALHNLHFYKMRRKKGKLLNLIWLGIRDSGIHIYEQQEPDNTTKTLLSTFLWCDIAKLHFEKKKFEIISEGSPEYRRFTYFVQSEDLAKNLLWMCRTTHHFHMANQNKVTDLKKLELEGEKPYRESYIYTDKADQVWEKNQKYKISRSTLIINKIAENFAEEKNLKPVTMKMSGMPWNEISGIESGRIDSQFVPQHHSMEALPFTNGCKFSSDIKYKSQSISCFSDRSLTPCPNLADASSISHLYRAACSLTATCSSISTTPTSTLMSRSSCTSNTDSTCSSLSLTSGSTIKVSSDFIVTLASGSSNDGRSWVKCDSFEELPVKDPLPPEKSLQKMCISTFVDKHVRTASVYDAVTTETVAKFQAPKQLASTSVSSLSTSSSSNAQKPTYVSSSLELHCGRNIDVKRTPSLNICKTNPCMSYDSHVHVGNRLSSPERNAHNNVKYSAAQKTNRHYVANAQNPVSSHGRTATRIGVSSLSRDQRLPLTLFNEHRITAAGSEPNLYVQISDHHPALSTDCNPLHSVPAQSRWLARNLNSRSEMSLNVIGQNFQYPSDVSKFGIPVLAHHDQCDARSRQMSLPDVCSDILDGECPDFPCIPPPPAYRNDAENGLGLLHENTVCSSQLQTSSHLPFNIENKTPVKNSDLPSNQTTDGHRELRSTLSSPPDVLDIQELRQRSRDLDLPLITALCNDRSLLMLPKTVPTCSRQRHIGNKDPMRFNRAASLPNGEATELPTTAGYTNGGRPISWHIDSAHVPHWSENSKPCSASWDNGIRTRGMCSPVVPADIIPPMLPPTILTSFGKTPEKQVKIFRDYSTASDSYRLNKNQLIPTKLLAGSIGGIPNGRLYQKGSSS